MSDLISPLQFGKLSTERDGLYSSFRGLYFGNLERSTTFRPPQPGERGLGTHEVHHHDVGDDEYVLSKLKPSQPENPDNPYRQQWPLYGQHWTANVSLAHQFALDPTHGHYRGGRTSRDVAYGAVLEARSSVKPENDPLASQYGESQIRFPRREHVQQLLMHLQKSDPADRHLGWEERTHLRTIEVPESQWRNS